ncbi:hypothetical protein QR680_003188 [Steinernema hermaphroditum]|uniref:Uncharacterized protein n=1 Tax=Steinernema hermaphroditum TaxID=289476 RepID=A0AA39LJ82_9BILA|nr:hypothetical protein QR680_003188 [Steinernema hermaphroditum]
MLRFGFVSCCLVAVALGQNYQINNPQQPLIPGQVQPGYQPQYPQQPQQYPQQFQPQYPAQNPYFQQSEDRFYCSALASFPVVTTSQTTTGGGSYGNGGFGFQQRTYKRQTCRYAATNSNESCNSCCKKASRLGNHINENDIFGTVFFFNPESPPYTTTVVTGTGTGAYGQTVTPSETITTQVDAATGRAQCLCCARRNN